MSREIYVAMLVFHWNCVSNTLFSAASTILRMFSGVSLYFSVSPGVFITSHACCIVSFIQCSRGRPTLLYAGFSILPSCVKTTCFIGSLFAALSICPNSFNLLSLSTVEMSRIPFICCPSLCSSLFALSSALAFVQLLSINVGGIF